MSKVKDRSNQSSSLQVIHQAHIYKALIIYRVLVITIDELILIFGL